MSGKRKFYGDEEYRADLKKLQKQVSHVLEFGTKKEISRAAKECTIEMNHLRMRRSMKLVSVVFPFIELPIIENSTQNISLLDVNSNKPDTKQLEDVLMVIERELGNLSS